MAAHRVLIADGAVSETLYCLALARHLGLPFVETWPRFHRSCDPVHALRSGRVPLAAGENAAWLVAPSERDIAVLLRAHAHVAPRPDIALTTPSHFSTLVRQKGRQAIAHAASEDLPDRAPHLSAKGATTWAAGAVAATAGLIAIAGIMLQSHVAADALGLLFLVGMLFRLCVCAAGLGRHRSAVATPLLEVALPTYTVLVALHREVAIAPRLVACLAALDYPASKLEVLFLVEQSDGATRDALLATALPPHFRVVSVPPGDPQTKPRALNVGLMLAKGDLLTVFDAEDRPEPDQLRKAAALFAVASPRVACLQARLAIANAANGLLPCLFAIEYAALFDVFNVGISRCALPMALGGTSNHFRTAVLRSVGGWDAWNVTEDADLGFRLSRRGYDVKALDSTTWEIALERLEPWVKQRRRWLKGWMQTLLVLSRDIGAAKDFGILRSFAVLLLLVNLVAGPLLTPLALCGVFWHVAREGLAMPHGVVEGLEAGLAAGVAILGLLSQVWCGWLGVRARRVQSGLARLPFLLPYNVMVSVAAWGALWDLIVAPYHWHKTDHAHAAREPVLAGVSRSSP